MTRTAVQTDRETTRAPAAVDARSLVKIYSKGGVVVRALDGLSVTVPAGQFTAIMGPSGSGKSTLLHCLAGLDTATSGEVWFGHINLSELTDSGLTRLRRDRVGFVFQSYNLVSMLTARQNILLPFELGGREPEWAWFDSVVRVLGLESRLAHKPAQLSGGEQQRVAVARALVTRPHVVFADEPTGNLDSRGAADLMAFLSRSVSELGQTVVMVTHDPVTAAYADRVLMLADGRLAGAIESPTRDSVLAALSRLGA
jgi:putative ABC transport system ATP-binding protein